MALPFDTVVVRSSDPPSRMSAWEFLALPLDRRIGLVLSRQIEFLLEGKPVDRRAALAAMQQLQANESS
jgi:hypothetical protein